MTTFSEAFSGESEQENPSVAVTTPVEGNKLIAILNSRSGNSTTNDLMNDDSDDNWVKRASLDQSIGDANKRHTCSVWERTLSAADEAFGTITVDGDGVAGDTQRLTVLEVLPGTAYDFTFEAASILGADSGTSPQGSGNTASVSGDDLFVIAVAAWRNGSSGVPASIAFTSTDAGLKSFVGASNARSHAFEYSSPGQSSGVKTSDVSWSNPDNECICAVLVFSTGAGGATNPKGPFGHPFHGPFGGPF